MRYIFFALLTTIIYQSGHSQTLPIELQNGDRVVFVGDGLFENDLDHGYLEFALTAAWPDRNIKFRNIGWSGDTPAGTSRDHFTNPPTAYDHLFEQIRSTRPTVAMVGYGSYLAFEDDAALDEFAADMEVLLDSLKTMELRVVLFSPAPLDAASSPVPATMVHQQNEKLQAVSKRLHEIAQMHQHPFVNLMDLLPVAENPNTKISDNGIHLNALGYFYAGSMLSNHLANPNEASPQGVDLTVGTDTRYASAIEQNDNSVSFNARNTQLPLPLPQHLQDHEIPDQYRGQSFQINGLRPGRYDVNIDGEQTETASANERARYIQIDLPHTEQAHQLMQSIQKKNRMYFYQYRPQNETYLVGFREYEQGNNARELDLLDPLIGEMENDIGRLRVPREMRVQVTRK